MTTINTTRRRPLWVDGVILFSCSIILVTMVLLGNWQVRRLYWKLDLIEAVETRKDAAPVVPPQGPVTFDDHAYLRVAATGTYQPDQSIRIKAITELGSGSWILTPLKTDTGHIWVNRGFVPAGSTVSTTPAPTGTTEVIGLLRLTEPKGTLLETNDPDAGRWFSRDIAALSENAGIDDAADYFIDAQATPGSTDWPRGGLTIVDFRNTHLQYALTWYAMALLFLAGIIIVIRGHLHNDDDS